MGEQWDPPRVAGEHASVDERGDRSTYGADLVAVERLAPDVEELAERVGACDRGLGVDDAVRRVGVQPHEAGPAAHERARRGLLHLTGRPDADAGRNPSRVAAHEDREVRVDVEENLLAPLAGDAVDALAAGDP